MYEEELDPEIFEIMAASQETLARCESYVVLPAEIRSLYNQLWIELGVTGGEGGGLWEMLQNLFNSF